jgi:hypothetical protein
VHRLYLGRHYADLYGEHGVRDQRRNDRRAGSNVALTASCPTSTTFTWTGGNCAGVTTNTCQATEATAVGNVNYTVTGNNSAADSHSINWTNTTVARRVARLPPIRAPAVRPRRTSC